MGALILQQMHDLTGEETVSLFGVRGLSAVGYSARLKAIGVNLFRTARVKRALDALRETPETPLSARGPIILAVKEPS